MNHRTPSPESSAGFRVACDPISPPAADDTAIPLAELIRGCADGNAEAWQEFMRQFHRIIAITAWRVARRWGENSPGVVDDLAQDTYLKLCADHARVLREFDSPHPLVIFAFLKVVTANVANDYFKRLHAGKRGGGHAGEPLENVEQNGSVAVTTSLASIELAVFLDEVDAVLCKVLPPTTRERDRTMFWLYYRQGLTAKEIASLPFGLSVKGVESTLHRLVQLVRTDVR